MFVFEVGFTGAPLLKLETVYKYIYGMIGNWLCLVTGIQTKIIKSGLAVVFLTLVWKPFLHWKNKHIDLGAAFIYIV